MSDKQSTITWNQAYRVSKSDDLWGGIVVPFIEKAIATFKNSNCRILIELPCGDGRNTIPLAKEFPFLIGADTSVNALELTRNALTKSNANNCLLMKADAFDLPFLNEQADGVFCCDLLGHLREPVAAISEMLRICKTGACLVGNVFSLGDSTREVPMQSLGNEEYIYDGRFYFKFYDEEAVSSLLDQFGQQVLYLERFRWQEPPHEGYREYPHEHESWVFAIQKGNNSK